MDNEKFIQELKSNGVIPFSELQLGMTPDFYGVIRTFKTVSQSKSGLKDHFLTFGMADPSVSWSSMGELRVNLFFPTRDGFPEVLKEGDICICKNMNLQLYPNRKQGISKSGGRSKWMFLDGETLEVRPCKNTCEMLDEDWDIARVLREWYNTFHKPDASVDPRQVISLTPKEKTSRRMIRTEEIDDTVKYFDYVGQVISYNRSLQYRKVELLLTDYTPNRKPMPGFHSDSTVDPELIIQCTLWDENADDCPDLEYGDYLHLRNCVASIGKLGYQEMNVRGDRNHITEFRKVKKLDNPEDVWVLAIKRRAEQYWEKKKGKTLEPRKIESTGVRTVVTEYVPRSYSSISQVLNSPKVNDRYKLRASVIAYKPTDVGQWVKKWCPRCDLSFNCEIELCDNCEASLDQFIYQCCFLVQDGPESRIILYCYGDDSQMLLKDLPPARPDEVSQKKLIELLDRICGKEYYDIGIVSYVIPGKGRRYNITGTQFIFE